MAEHILEGHGASLNGKATRTLEDTTIGGWNSGVIAYYSGRQVVNLDGVINDQVIDYLRRRRLEDYLDRRSIDLVVELRSEIRKFMKRFGGREDWPSRLKPVAALGRVSVLRREP